MAVMMRSQIGRDHAQQGACALFRDSHVFHHLYDVIITNHLGRIFRPAPSRTTIGACALILKILSRNIAAMSSALNPRRITSGFGCRSCPTWDVLHLHGISVPNGCRHGACGGLLLLVLILRGDVAVAVFIALCPDNVDQGIPIKLIHQMLLGILPRPRSSFSLVVQSLL